MPRLFGPTPSAAAAQVLPWNQYLDQSYNTSVGLDRQRQQMELEDAYRNETLGDSRIESDRRNILAQMELGRRDRDEADRMAMSRRALALQERQLRAYENAPYDQDFFNQLSSERQLSNQLAILDAQVNAQRRAQSEAAKEKMQMEEAGRSTASTAMADLMQQSDDLGKTIARLSLAGANKPTPWYEGGGYIRGTTGNEYASVIKNQLVKELGVDPEDPIISGIKNQESASLALSTALNNLTSKKKAMDAEIAALNKQGVGLYVQPFMETPEVPEEEQDLPAPRPQLRYRSTYRPSLGPNPFMPVQPVIPQPEAGSMPRFNSQRAGQEAAKIGRWRQGTRYIAPGVHGAETVYEIR